MRYRNNLLLALLLMLGAAGAQAQSGITALNLSPSDSLLSSQCSVPLHRQFSAAIYASSGGSTTDDTVTVLINYGDGTTDSVVAFLSGIYLAYFDHIYTIPGTYSTQIIAKTQYGVADTATLSSDPLVITSDCGNLTGTVYEDANGNCIYDAGETLLNDYITITDSATGAQYSTYAYNGVYSITLPNNATYTVNGNNAYWWANLTPTCPAGATASVTLTGSGTAVQNFVFSAPASSNVLDLVAEGWACNFRPGYTRPLAIGGYDQNYSGITGPVTFTLTLPANLSYSSTSYGPAPTTVSGGTLTWNVLTVDSDFYAEMEIYCDPSATIGDSACLTLTVTPAAGTTETNTANNTYSFCVPINNSMDPNNKTVSPRGTGSEGYIDAQTEGLTYLVNFQNTGNEVAYNVTIADELDANIDPASIYVVGASHAYTTTIADGSMLKFRFSGINLPDSNSNEPASHGWVMYRARITDASHQPGTVIHNTANIYFDYNEAIVTNTTTTTLMTPSAGVEHLSMGKLEATVAPNPADGSLTVSVKDGQAATATLTDMTGRLVAQQEGAAGRMELATKALPAGLYLLQVRSGSAVLNTRVSVKH